MGTGKLEVVTINRKLLLSILLLFALALFLNVNAAAATNVTTNHPPKVTSVNPVNNSIILKSQTVKVNFNESIKAGTQSIILKNMAGTVIKTKNSISYKTLSIIPTTPLATGVKYNLILNTGSIKDLSGTGNSYYSTCFTVSPITLAQMKDGLFRSQTFVNKYLRLPSYVSYGSEKIPIAEFQKIIATQGLKINTKIRDLTVTKVTAPIRGVKGNTIIVPNTIKNQGNTATSGFWVSYYLKISSTSSNNYIGQRFINSLAAGASNSQNTQLSIPINITSSNYYIMAYADSSKLVNESYETNNYRYSSTKIQIINCRPIYITSDNIKNTTTDNARINSIVTGLRSMGLYAVNYGLGPNSHYQILTNKTIPKNALIVNIYGGVCAGTIWEMTQHYYTSLLGNRSVFSIWINTLTNIADVSFLQRAHDDNFTPLYGTLGGFPNFNDLNKNGKFEPGAGFVNGTIYPTKFLEVDGIVYPAKLLLQNGYHYLYQQNGDINTIEEKIFQMATTL